MTHFHYYATTAGKTDRILQYSIHPAAVLFAHHVFGCDNRKANFFAQAATALCSAAMTSVFFGLESDIIDQDSYKAVSAEMGISPEEVKFSDYGKSNNIIVRRAAEDLSKLQKYRYLSDLLFLLPMALDTAQGAMYPKQAAVNRAKQNEGSLLDWRSYIRDVGPGLAGKSAYWAYETFMIPKTSHYEVVKVRENMESTGKRVSADDMLAIYQRARDDAGLKRIGLADAEEYNTIMPLLERIAKEYDKHTAKFGMAEIVYLIGMGKVNIYGPDNKTISAEAVERSAQEIERVASIGLDGIREENRRRRGLGLEAEKSCYSSVLPHKRGGGFAEAFTDGAFDISQAVLAKVFTKRPIEEYVTRRDPSEVTTNINFTAGRG